MNKLNLPHIIYKENDRWADLNFDSAMKQFRSGFKKSIENLSKETNVVVTFTIPENGDFIVDIFETAHSYLN